MIYDKRKFNQIIQNITLIYAMYRKSYISCIGRK